MVTGADRDFDRGVSPLGSVILQEIAGGLLLVALTIVVVRLVRGASLRPWVAPSVAAACLVWLLLRYAERAS